MKDFALIAGSSGSFPDVVSTDCSGVGETDGFAVISDYLNDSGLGWIQALLNDQGLTPNGSTESDAGTSQILQAIKLLAFSGGLLALPDGQTEHNNGTQLPEWIYQFGSGGNWATRENTGKLVFPLRLPPGLTLDLDIDCDVTPGAIRAGGNRMAFRLYYIEYGDASHTQIGSTVYDDGTAANQTVNITASSITTSVNRQHILRIDGGNDAGANYDTLLNVSCAITLA